jgi:hypothetical protein
MANGFAAPAGGGSSGSPLDGPPPSPTAMSTPAPGAPPFGMKGLAGPPQVSSSQMPPEVLTGITQAAQTISQTLDSFAQVTPDKAPALSMIKELLQQYLAEIMVAGASPVSPTAAGAAPPMGGMDHGIAGAGSV